MIVGGVFGSCTVFWYVHGPVKTHLDLGKRLQ